MSLTTPSPAAPSSDATTPASGSPRMAGVRRRYEADGKVVASPAKLVVLLYERLLRDLDEAEAALRSGDSDGGPELVHAQEIIDVLDVSLDRAAWSGAVGLGSIYQHLHDELVTANIRRDPARVAACRTLVLPLLDAWREASTSPAPVP